jgi:hypothetical protein
MTWPGTVPKFPEPDHMKKAINKAVEKWLLVLRQSLYVLNGRPINLKSRFQFLKADQSFCPIAQRRMNVVIMKYRGVEFYIQQIKENRWNWRIPSRMETSIPVTGVVGGNIEATIAKCHSVIDNWLGRNRIVRHDGRFPQPALPLS